jgi:hypothetical protein
MTVKRKFCIVFAVVFVLIVAAVVFLLTNLDWIVKNAIERYGSRALGTSVRVDRVALKPGQGKGTIEGLTVANPRGYTAPHLLSLGGISVRLAPGTVTENPVVIDDIRVTAPLVVYEMNDKRVANVDVLKKNLGAGKPALEGKKRPKDKGRKLRIRRLVIENAKAEVRVAGDDRTRTVSLPRIEMKDVGGRNGAPPEEVAKQIVNAIVSEATHEVGKAGATRLLENALERALKRK